jgi:hypothetical protein
VKRQLLVTINAGETTCDGCTWATIYQCQLFDDKRGVSYLLRHLRDGSVHRCRACLAAEKPARKAKGGGR